LMHYYFVGQRQDLTAGRFNCRPEKIRVLVASAIAFIDGQLCKSDTV